MIKRKQTHACNTTYHYSLIWLRGGGGIDELTEGEADESLALFVLIRDLCLAAVPALLMKTSDD